MIYILNGSSVKPESWIQLLKFVFNYSIIQLLNSWSSGIQILNYSFISLCWRTESLSWHPHLSYRCVCVDALTPFLGTQSCEIGVGDDVCPWNMVFARLTFFCGIGSNCTIAGAPPLWCAYPEGFTFSKFRAPRALLALMSLGFHASMLKLELWKLINAVRSVKFQL